jgi:hypothetical protein
MAREMEFTSKDPDFAEKLAWSLHEVLGCPLRAAAHDETGWCSRREQLLGIANRLRQTTLEAKSEPEPIVAGQLTAWAMEPDEPPRSSP